MNPKIYILAVSCFVIGTVELIIGGILDIISKDLGISVSTAGNLITIYSVFFALSAPILLNATARFERKKTYLWTLFAFFLSNILSAFSVNYGMLFTGRIVAAMSGSFLVVLSTTMASRMVAPEFKGRAIGTIFMGISASLVLGIPIGILVGNAYGWRAVFILIAVLTAVIMIGVQVMLEKAAPPPVISLRVQLRSLKEAKIVATQLSSGFLLAGHLTLYAYLTPFLRTALHLNTAMVTAMYLVFGIAAVAGGGIGGFSSDKWGSKKSILTIITLFFVMMLLIPFSVEWPIYLFTAVIILWSALSWAISPAQNNFIIQMAPHNSDILLSLNTTASHLGIALGSFIGGIVIEHTSIIYNAWVGAVFVLIALLCSIFSVTRHSESQNAEKYIHS
ncbi:MFS transporter [Peribacillus sp. B-H-3]|uniref:MFS transporter n=1 Tax=Peribacillus sp. B-H-3 TaxID=3400420 RepID=UPI003B02982A